MDCDESNEVNSSDPHQHQNQSMSSVHADEIDDKPALFVNSIIHHGIQKGLRNQETVTTKPLMPVLPVSQASSELFQPNNIVSSHPELIDH